MMNKKIKILRSAVGCLSIAGMIRKLQKRGVEVIGLDCNPLAVGFYLCNKHYLAPRGDNPKFIKKILKICDREKPQAIISGPEEETLVLAKNKNLFKKRKIVVFVPDYETVKICIDKIKTNNFFQQNNIPCPKIFSTTKIEYPCIIKPSKGRGGRDIFIVKNRQELKISLKKVKKPIIQEYVNGEEYTIDTFTDFEGNILSIIPRKRLGVESGISVKGVTVNDKGIIEYCQKIVKNLKLTGPACIQCIKNNQGVKFIEINSRFGGGSILSIEADPSIIDNLIKIAKGERPIKSKGFKEGLTMLRYYSEVYT